VLEQRGGKVVKPVALDAMGGDRAPEATVAGALLAARSGVKSLLVGDESRLAAELARQGGRPAEVGVVHAGETIGMDESPGQALLRKRDSSIVVAMNLVREGRACGMASTGNSGAVTGAALLRLGMVPGVDRPAIAIIMPTQKGQAVLLDAGATVDARAEHLLEFAYMGEIYARCVLKVDRPRVGLLSIGEEASKGNALIKETRGLLAEARLHFIGNVEGKDVARGAADVVVCDGFAGNVMLKAIEGYGELFWSLLKQEFASGLRGRIGGLLMRSALKKVASKLDYASYGGALLLGVNGVVVIGHGRSSPEAVANALRVGREVADRGVVEELAESLKSVRPREEGERILAAGMTGESESEG
jgi:glycerol-3-phosphate acyltransferase PlsX